MYHAKIQCLQETIQKLQMEKEEENDLPSKKTFKRQKTKPSMPNVNVKIKTVKSTKKNKNKQNIKRRKIPFKPKTPIKKPLSEPDNITPTRKKKNHQIRNDYFPTDFKSVKDELYNHIKLLWGLLERNSVPEPTDPKVLKQFQARFATFQDFESHVANPNSNILVANSEIETLNAGHSGRVKLGQGIVQLEDSEICYIHGYLGKLGIECWVTNLDESSENFWNSACLTSAINLFFQMAASGVYQNSSLNHGYLDDGECSRVYDEEDDKDYNGESEDEGGDEEEEDETEKEEEEEEAEMSDSNDDTEEDE
ncbi:hypothetical protein O181_089005 [Austropuccinia psidii MF-1]|uniref:Uncharacterized protein n=1 Tax=Austropuccinia psidii MF-1 TaxID=1389203 RepID=A0A9Q3P506_9BASI|nr:hypothetical protein [Austropuccinia psidii MF-1]